MPQNRPQSTLYWVAIALGLRARRAFALAGWATLTISVLGESLADVLKHGHRIPNTALAWWIVGVGAARVACRRAADQA